MIGDELFCASSRDDKTTNPTLPWTMFFSSSIHWISKCVASCLFDAMQLSPVTKRQKIFFIKIVNVRVVTTHIFHFLFVWNFICCVAVSLCRRVCVCVSDLFYCVPKNFIRFSCFLFFLFFFFLCPYSPQRMRQIKEEV